MFFSESKKPTSRCKSFKWQINSTALSFVDKETFYSHTGVRGSKNLLLEEGEREGSVWGRGKIAEFRADLHLERTLSLWLMIGRPGQLALPF